MSLFSVSDVKVSFGGSPILNGVSFSVEEATAVGLIGPNGCGKTTLFNCISGFIRPTSGKVFLSGADISGLPPHERARRGLARVFQNSGVFRNMSVEENMIVALETHSKGYWPRLAMSAAYKKLQKQSLELLEEVGLAAKAKDKASSLSGGQLRLLEISRAVAMGAQMLLLDEPTAGVSPKMKEEVVGLIAKLTSRGKTVLIIEHDIELIEQFCSRIVVLDAGTVVMDDSPAVIRGSELLQEIYFGKVKGRVQAT